VFKKINLVTSIKEGLITFRFSNEVEHTVGEYISQGQLLSEILFEKAIDLRKKE
jgi:hypothetical protein